jgi:hypothetical protein
MFTSDKHTPDENDFLLELLELVRPDQIDKLLAIARQKGRPIADIITEALWRYFKETGALDRYHKEHGLPEDWPTAGGDWDAQ